MKKSLRVLIPLFFALSLVSCNNDDDSSSSSEVLEDREDQAIIDDTVVEGFLENYSYNDIVFENNEEATDQDIIFYKVSRGAIADSTSGKSLMESDKLSKYTYTYDDENDDEITQTYYVVSVRDGEGKEINEADRIDLTYQTKVILTNEDNSNARLLETNKQNLDSLTNPTWFSSVQFIAGFNQALTKFKTGSLTDVNDPCSIYSTGNGGEIKTNNDFGIGIVIMPSGLGYFNGEFYFNNYEDDDEDGEVDDTESEDSFGYRNLILTFSTYNAVDQDLDGDGIPSAMEDFNNNGDFDDDDTDKDDIPNYLDTDDDGDGVLTFFEIELLDLNDDVDSDCDGTLNNDNDVQFIYPNEDETQTPYHLDSDLEYDED